MGKKSLKKNKYSVNTNVDLYKEEFSKNIKITYINNIFYKKNLNFFNKNNYFDFSFETNNNVFLNNGTSLNGLFLKTKKKLFSSEVFLNSEYKYLFLNFSEEKFFKTGFFKKTQKFTNIKEGTDINNLILKTVKTWDFNNSESYNLYFKKVILKNSNLNTIQHTDLDDETRIIKRNLGKNTPIRVLKQPKNDFYIHDNQENYLELLRFRFNEKTPTTANKPIKPTVYLTFKQKRYNQRNVIGKKNVVFLDKETNKIQKYSGNPFLKNSSIIEDNFSNPTRQYRMVKKAKTRVDNTRVSNWNRLLRSRRVLVLPAHINITVITNSFDIVHS